MKLRHIACFSLLILISTAQASSEKAEGIFTITNETDKVIDVAVGAFLPITYTVQAHSWRTVWESGPDITIKKLY
jgi:hypothetical protein